jgi:ribonuclease BN (tRNA processing enzyme)
MNRGDLMRCTFVGVGEAFDETFPNTSILLESEGASILLDCGFTAAPAFWRHSETPLDLSAVWISHFHADHWFGLPWLVARMNEDGRSQPLTLMGREGIHRRVEWLLDMAYPGLRDKLGFELRYRNAAAGGSDTVHGFRVRFAHSGHSIESLAIRLERDGKCVFYSGDGAPTEESVELARNCDLLIQESYIFSGPVDGHGSVEEAITMMKRARAGKLALVHLNRRLAAERLRDVDSKLYESRVDGFVPQPGDSVDA